MFRYFICGMPGHCTQGMKLEVNVIPTANSAPTAPVPNSVNSIYKRAFTFFCSTNTTS